MKVKELFFYLFAVIIIIQGSVCTNAQPVNDSVLLRSPFFREKIQLFTDRNIYAVSEKILFRAFNLSDHEVINTNWSKILYVEIVSRTNTPIAQAKFILNKHGTSGYIEIPESAPTGSFFLRAYTKWMRNFSPSGYFYQGITIINPHENDLQTGEDLLFSNAGTSRHHSEIQRNAILCKTRKHIYHRREKATVNISLAAGRSPSPNGYCITVVRKGALNTHTYSMKLPGDTYEPETIDYFPETTGLSLSGRIVSKNHQTAMPYARIHLSIPGKHTDFISCQADMEGFFRLLLPLDESLQDVILTIESDPDQPVEVIVDDNYSADYVQLPELPINASAEQDELIQEIRFNMQIQEIFRESLTVSEPAEKRDSSFGYFYGQPLISLKSADYVKLPTLEEFFFELIPTVNLQKKADKKYFTVHGNHTDLTHYKPLILLDQVPVTDIKTLLPVSPEKIDHIDIINATYVRGSVQFGGIINIISREGDRGGIDFPQNSFFFDLKGFELQQELKFSDDNRIPQSERIPDLRNCLFWTPDIEMEAGECVSFDFHTSDVQGEYIIVVRGISSDGEILEGQCTFRVQ